MNYVRRAKEKAKAYATRHVVAQMARMLANASDESLIRMTRLAERFMVTDTQRRYVRETRVILEQGHPALDMMRNFVSRDLHPNYYQNMVVNFFTNALFMGYGIRKEILAKEGIMPPFFFVISPTMRCNLGCYGCYAGQYKKSDELDFDTVCRIISEARDMGMYFVTISGGEPFFYESLLDIFEKHHDMSYQIYTNGTLIDDKVVERLVSLGNAAPAISVEGYEAETDARRGKGTYAKVRDAMGRLKDAGALFGFSATVTRHNADLLSSEEFVDTMVDRGCAFGWYFIYIPIGREPQLDLMPTPEQRDMLRQRVKRMRSTKPILVADFWNDGPLVGGCIAGGRRYLHINCKGDVEPCVFVHFAVDNIKEKSLMEAIKSPFFTSIRERQKINNENPLLPCMIIDHPETLRELVAEHGAYPTHDGAETLVNEMADYLDSYAVEYGKLANEAWKSYGKKDIWTRDVWTVDEEDLVEADREVADD
jgi:MoaA/NifB/PqqE/SkfB family radical SAM enzyme